MYNPYLAPQYPQIYGASGTVSPPVYPYTHMGQALQAGPAFPTHQGYGVQGPHLVHFPGPGGGAMTSMPQQYAAAVPVIQGPVPSAGMIIMDAILLRIFSHIFSIQDRTDT
jgi:hypothetical protein